MSNSGNPTSAPSKAPRTTILLNPSDNVATALTALAAGQLAHVERSGGAPLQVPLRDNIPLGHKLALCDIRTGEAVIKYGMRIGTATQDIFLGALVDERNLE